MPCIPVVPIPASLGCLFPFCLSRSCWLQFVTAPATSSPYTQLSVSVPRLGEMGMAD
ncbi:hypothetical protein K505DRAFT_325565 [Melanomma pulvis-pyrius CBS 109.77]|uniref:Uncharacterized protein n=1 Tax=Melanomma pulvis-pyrius CBS 109.77 TaxID=1314802 RepID=A0A6A6XBM9_9PLEO|nr:hypothetical protein K505DRAFT_325565 [Melanomma pulvis-pyrius CBS 109.77]